MKSVYEELEKTNNFKQHKRRVNALKEHDTTISIRTLLYGNFNTKINLQMPEVNLERDQRGLLDNQQYYKILVEQEDLFIRIF